VKVVAEEKLVHPASIGKRRGGVNAAARPVSAIRSGRIIPAASTASARREPSRVGLAFPPALRAARAGTHFRRKLNRGRIFGRIFLKCAAGARKNRRRSPVKFTLLTARPYYHPPSIFFGQQF
jgi:hypothetical protein